MDSSRWTIGRITMIVVDVLEGSSKATRAVRSGWHSSDVFREMSHDEEVAVAARPKRC